MAKRLLKITEKELHALIKTAESCYSGDLISEAKAAIKAYQAILKKMDYF